MYEETKSSIDWKGIFLKVVIAFLIVLIAVKGYSTLKGNNDKKVETTTNATAESKSSSTFTANIEELRKAGEEYFSKNTNKLPENEGNTTIVTLNELINEGVIKSLADEDGKTCDGESSYVTATLEGKKTKLKANLVCGNASSYSLVYMGENDNEVEEKKETTSTTSTTKPTSSNSNSSTKTTSTKSSSTKSSSTKSTTNTCSTNCGTPSVTVNTNTTATQKVTITNGSTNKNNTPNNTNNKPSYNTNTNKKVIYTVSFDSNGGSREYPSQEVEKYNTASYPGETYKSGYTFKGWYLNGSKYDFSAPVTQNITLIAEYTRNYDIETEKEERLITDTYYSYVYTMGWNFKDTGYMSVDHTLRVPEYIEELDVEKVKISDITFYKAIDTKTLATTYRNKHRDTFFYEKNGWESTTNATNTLATIRKSAVDFDYSTRYKSIDDALDNGFGVNWTANDIYKECTSTFSVNGVSNLCNYGIVYKVEWTYKYYR